MVKKVLGSNPIGVQVKALLASPLLSLAWVTCHLSGWVGLCYASQNNNNNK
jgi:hypothetical protein